MRDILIKMMVLMGMYILVVSMCSLQEQQIHVKDTQVVKQKEGKKEKKEEVMVQVMYPNETKHIPLEIYLEGVVASEMPYTFALEALKAQCVAARTFVLQRNLLVDASTNAQVYRSENELIEIHQDNYDTMIAKVREAIQQTKGIVMRYDGNYISALFYSSNNGFSNDASWYYQNEVPYLKSVDSHWDTTFEQSVQTKSMTTSECMQKLGIRNLHIQHIKKYPNGYIQSISIAQQQFTGREIREKLQLRSSCFTLQVQGNQVVIETKGFGHGVGMSQYGAQGMALEGSDFKSILRHYYQGVSIEEM